MAKKINRTNVKVTSSDIIKLYSKDFEKKLEVDIVTQCAPVILGEKISNILITEEKNRREAEMMFHYAGFSTYLFYHGNEKVMMLIYNKTIFWDYIRKKECSEFLEKYGYNLARENIAYEVFSKIAPKFSAYMKTKQNFPHELGILLGYPLKDVQGFIENKGKNFLYSGYWKVYSDLQNALLTFERYNRAKSVLIKMVLDNISIWKILGIFQISKQEIKEKEYKESAG